MNTNNYNDLIRDAKLLKKLLLAEDIKFSLNHCQEITSRLYKYSSLHEAQQVLNQQNNVETTYNYSVQLEDIQHYISNMSQENIWLNQAVILVEAICKTFFTDTNNINIKKLIRFIDLTELLKFNTPQYPLIQHALLSTRELIKLDTKDNLQRNAIFKELTENMFKPYIHQMTKDILLSGNPGIGKTTWAEILINNWRISHPTKKVIIVDIMGCWNNYLQYITNTETNTRVTTVHTNDLNLNTDLLNIINKYLNNTDILCLNINDYKNSSPLYELLYTALKQFNNNDNTLIVFDELQRARNITSLSKPQTISTTYLYVTQGDIDVQYELDKLIPFKVISTSETGWINTN